MTLPDMSMPPPAKNQSAPPPKSGSAAAGKATQPKKQQQPEKRQKRTTPSTSSDSEPAADISLADLRKDIKTVQDRQQSNEAIIQENTDSVERLRRANDVIVRGVQLAADHDETSLRAIITSIASLVECELSSRDMVFVRQLSRKDSNDSLILIRFATAAVRRDFLTCNRKVEGGLTTKMLEPDCPVSERIYVSDNLTNRNAAIRRKAVQLKTQGLIHMHVVRNGLVHVVVNKDDRLCPVTSIGDLNTLALNGKRARRAEQK